MTDTVYTVATPQDALMHDERFHLAHDNRTLVHTGAIYTVTVQPAGAGRSLLLALADAGEIVERQAGPVQRMAMLALRWADLYPAPNPDEPRAEPADQ